MRASEHLISTVRRAVRSAGQKVSGSGRTARRTVAGQSPLMVILFSGLDVSGKLSGGVRTLKKSAVCPVGVSLGHPTPETRTNVHSGPDNRTKG
jgi:hypothetical protein